MSRLPLLWCRKVSTVHDSTNFREGLYTYVFSLLSPTRFTSRREAWRDSSVESTLLLHTLKFGKDIALRVGAGAEEAEGFRGWDIEGQASKTSAASTGGRLIRYTN
jgi:hypothetical protein